MIEEMRRQNSNQSYDEQPLPSLNSEAIDFRAASELFHSKKSLKISDFETLRVVVRHQGREVPTIGGMLLFGKDRTRHFPDAWIHAGLFGGKDRSKILDSNRIAGYLPQAAEEAILFVTRHLSHSLAIGDVRHRRVLSLPPIAVREAIINAVVHADYSQRGAPIRISLFSDRLEIENPGMLAPGLTLEDVQRGVSKIRNRVVARVFNELGYIEQWGSGIQRMFRACAEAGLKKPLLEEVGPHFRATLFMGKERSPFLDPVDRKIIGILEVKALSTQEIADRIHKSVRAARTRLLSLIQRGLVIEIGSGPNDPQKKYHLPSGE
jgi:predicted HTH transcriptional regulator